MPLHVYNTLTRKKDLFEPATPGVVRIYTCGLTVYAPMHIGHARTYCFWDFFRRYLEYLGYHVVSVINYTDIDDRIMNAASDVQGSVDLAEKMAAIFRRDCRLLRIKDYAAYTRATDFIDGQIELAAKLIELGNAYVVDGEVFYDVESFPGYGKLSGRKVEEQEVGASGRVGEDVTRKHNPADFTLWKPSEGDQPRWETGHADWPQGRPGWHLECSVMSTTLLGSHFDVHGGAVDNMFPHHENEIAQSEPVCGAPWVRYWLHPEHLDLRGEKMSKSLGNVIGIPDLLTRHRYDEVRWFYAMNHYRTKLAFSDELIDAASEGYGKIVRLLNLLKSKLEKAVDVESGIPIAGKYASERPKEQRWPRFRHQYMYGRFGEISQKYIKRFGEALDDDLNTPQATAATFDYVNELYAAGIDSLDLNATDERAIKDIDGMVRQAHFYGYLKRMINVYHQLSRKREAAKRNVELRSRLLDLWHTTGLRPSRLQDERVDKLTQSEISAAILIYVLRGPREFLEFLDNGPLKHPQLRESLTASVLAVYRCLTRHLYVLGCEFPNQVLYPQLAADCFVVDTEDQQGQDLGAGKLDFEMTYMTNSGFIGNASRSSLIGIIDTLLAQRQQARADKDFAKSDQIRDMLAAAGVLIEDTPSGPRWELK